MLQPQGPVPRNRLGCLTQIIMLVILAVVVGVGLPALLTPWGFTMGGRFHMIPMWQGVGTLHSTRAGGDYVIYIWFSPKVGRTLGPRHVSGNGYVCTPRGEKIFLSLGGDFQKDMGLDSNGKTARFYMDNSSTKSKFSGDRRPYLELNGKWQNPDLVLDDHGSIARAFEPDGSVYQGHSGSRPYMAEVLPVTLHEGGKSDFEAACRTAAARH